MPDHTVQDFSVQIAEVVLDKKDLCSRELFWIKLLNTAYPFGLNDNIAGYGNVSEGTDPLLKKGHPYFAIRCKSKTRNKNTTRKRRVSRQLNNQVINDLSTFLNNKSFGYVNRIIVYLKKQSQKTLRVCHSYIASIDDSCDSVLRLMLTGFLAGYFTRLVSHCKISSKMLSVDRLIMRFSSLAFDDLKIESIFKMSQVKRANLLPLDMRRKIELVFTYKPPFSVLVFNYAKELRKVANSNLLASMLERPCFCHDSAYIYTPFEHIVTGNLKIVENNDLRSILAKGTKYRIPDYNMTNIITDFISGLDNLLFKIAARSRIPLSCFKLWRNEVLNVLYKKWISMQVHRMVRSYAHLPQF